MTPMSWTMFVLSCLALAIAFYIRFGERAAAPSKWLLHLGVGMMCFGFFWLWYVIDGIPEKYPDPALRVLTSSFWGAAGGLCIATFLGRRSNAGRDA